MEAGWEAAARVEVGSVEVDRAARRGAWRALQLRIQAQPAQSSTQAPCWTASAEQRCSRGAAAGGTAGSAEHASSHEVELIGKALKLEALRQAGVEAGRPAPVLVAAGQGTMRVVGARSVLW